MGIRDINVIRLDIVLSTAPFDVHLQAKLYGIPRPFSIVGIPFVKTTVQ